MAISTWPDVVCMWCTVVWVAAVACMGHHFMGSGTASKRHYVGDLAHKLGTPSEAVARPAAGPNRRPGEPTDCGACPPAVPHLGLQCCMNEGSRQSLLTIS